MATFTAAPNPAYLNILPFRPGRPSSLPPPRSSAQFPAPPRPEPLRPRLFAPIFSPETVINRIQSIDIKRNFQRLLRRHAFLRPRHGLLSSFRHRLHRTVSLLPASPNHRVMPRWRSARRRSRSKMPRKPVTRRSCRRFGGVGKPPTASTEDCSMAETNRRSTGWRNRAAAQASAPTHSPRFHLR